MTPSFVRDPRSGLRLGLLATALTVIAALQACGGDDICTSGPFCQTPPVKSEASSIQAGPGNAQTGSPGRQLQDPVAVIVVDSAGHGVSGITVRFSVSSGGGALSSDTAQSNSDGVAEVNWQLGTALGAQSLRAEASNGDGAALDNSPLELSAQAVPAQPAQLVLITTLADSAQNGVRFETQPVIQVFDADTQPVAGVEVLASVASGGATISGTASATSDANGQASFTDLALVGPQAAQTLQFSVTTPALAITSNPIQLVAGSATSLTGVEPLTYEGTVSSPVSPGPSVVAKDAAGNPVPGVSIDFSGNRDASVSPETAVTNEQGIAQVSWTLGSTATSGYTLTARIAGASVRFSATARAGAAGRLRITTQPSSPTQSGTPFTQQPVIQVVDQNGNPTAQAGLTVTATVSSGPKGTVQGGTATTDGSGRAAFSGLAVTGAAGSYTLTFSASGVAGVTSAPFSIQAGGAARLAFVTHPSTAARSRAPLVIQPVLQIQDASGNPIHQQGTVITASTTTGSTTLSNATATTDANGRAAFSGLTITGIPGPKDLSFSAPGLQSVSASVMLPSVKTVSVAPSHPVSAPVGSTVAGPVVAFTFKDAATRVVPDADFGLTLPQGGTTAQVPAGSDANGVVQISDWTLGTNAGYQYLELRLPDKRVFRDSILATAGPAADLVIFSGDHQSGDTNSTLLLPLVVRAVDQFGNGVASVPVAWATCPPNNQPGAGDPMTDENGFASASQPTGAVATDQGCTQATGTINGADKAVQFHYTVNAGGSSGVTGPSGAARVGRQAGPPPIAPQRTRLRSSR
jgi:Bacterial Ig-like domain (group 1)/Carboxypeptidase regulatory-like domain